MARGNADGSIVIDTELDNTGVAKGSAEMEKRIASLSATVTKFGQNMQKSVAGYSSTVAGSIGQILDTEFTNTISGIQAKLSALGDVKVPTDQYKQLSDETEKAGQKLETLLNKQERMRALGLKENSSQWKALQYDLDTASRKYDELAAAKARMESDGSAYQLGSESAEYQRLATALQQLQATVEANEAPTSRLGTVFASLGDRLRAAGSAALRTAKNLATMPFKAAANGVKAIAKEMQKYTGQTAKAALTSNGLIKSLTSIKRLLISRIKRMFISAIFNNVKEGIQQLARYSSEFNTVMSGLKNTATQSAGNIAVAFGNIITAAAPALLKLMDILSQAITYLNQFFALLNGKRTVTVAKKGTEDYAQAAGAAAAAQKEFNAELYGFDELTRQNKKNDTSGGTADAPTIEYEEIPVDLPKGVVDWVDRLKEAWKNQKWYDVGQVLADGLNTAIDAVDDWINNTLRPNGMEWARRIATILNGLFDGVNWKNLGKALADGFNAVVDIVAEFFKTLSFKSVVQAIEDFLAGALQTVNPLALIGAIFLPKLLKAVKAVIVTHPVAAIVIGALLALGPQLGETLQKMVDNINFADVGKALSDGFKWVLNRLSDALESVDWQALTTALFQGLIDLITAIDWPGLVSAMFRLLGAAVGAAVGVIVSLAENIWVILKGAWDSVKTYFADYFDQYGGDIIAGLWAGIKNAFANVGNWIYDNILLPFINGFKAAFGIASPSKVMKEMGGYLIQGLFNGISDTWRSITKFFDSALSDLKTALSKAWKDIKKTTSDTWDNIKTSISNSFTNAKTSVLNTASTIKNNLSTAWSGIKSSAQTAWSNISSTASTSFANLSRSVSSAWGNLRTALGNVQWNNVGHNLVAGLANGISGAWGGLMSGVSNLVNGLISRIKSLFGVHSPSTVFAEIGGYLDEGLQQGMENGERGLASTAANIANAVTEGMTPDAPKVQMTADGVVGGMQAVISGLSGIAATFQTIVDALTAIGGFIMPQIAAGTVTPYSTRVDNNPTDTDDPDGVTSYLLSILSELQALARIANNGNGQSCEVKLLLDGKSVYETVVQQNTRAWRQTGSNPLVRSPFAPGAGRHL